MQLEEEELGEVQPICLLESEPAGLRLGGVRWWRVGLLVGETFSLERMESTETCKEETMLMFREELLLSSSSASSYTSIDESVFSESRGITGLGT